MERTLPKCSGEDLSAGRGGLLFVMIGYHLPLLNASDIW